MKRSAFRLLKVNSPGNIIDFYPRVVNNTDISFTTEEHFLLNKGLKYKLHFKYNNWLHILALEVEVAAIHLPTHEQDGVHHLIVQRVQQLHRQQKQGRIHSTVHAKKKDTFFTPSRKNSQSITLSLRRLTKAAVL
jgi:hypothetical protein